MVRAVKTGIGEEFQILSDLRKFLAEFLLFCRPCYKKIKSFYPNFQFSSNLMQLLFYIILGKYLFIIIDTKSFSIIWDEFLILN